MLETKRHIDPYIGFGASSCNYIMLNHCCFIFGTPTVMYWTPQLACPKSGHDASGETLQDFGRSNVLFLLFFLLPHHIYQRRSFLYTRFKNYIGSFCQSKLVNAFHAFITEATWNVHWSCFFLLHYRIDDTRVHRQILPKPSKVDEVNVNRYCKMCTTLYPRIISDKAILLNIGMFHEISSTFATCEISSGL